MKEETKTDGIMKQEDLPESGSANGHFSVRVGIAAIPHQSVWRAVNVWAAPLALLVALWVYLASAQGGSLPRQWLLPAVATAFFTLVITILAAYPRRPRQGALAVLGLFLLYAIWVTASLIWADSTARAWEEVNRTLSYLIFLASAFMFLADQGARRTCRYLLVAAALALLIMATWRLHAAQNIGLLFTGNGFSFPVSYPNNAAALYLVLFWPLLWIAADPQEWVPLRGLALGAASALLGFAIMTQSRGALWAFALTVILWFMFSPVRLRTLVFFVIPLILAVWSFPEFNRYWIDGPAAVGPWPAVYHTILAFLVAAVLGTVLALLERWVHVSRRMRIVFGSIALAVIVATTAYGAVLISRESGSLTAWAGQSWSRLTQEQTGSLAPDDPSATGNQAPPSRLATLSTSGRWDIWRAGWIEFRTSPVIGVGANNFVVGYYQLRTSESAKVQQPHSIGIRVLSETGAMGGVLFFGFVVAGLGISIWPRTNSSWQRARGRWLFSAKPVRKPGRFGSDPAAHAWPVALAFGVLYWLIHGSVEWLWHMPGVTLGPLLLMALAVSVVDANAGELWPRLAHVGRARDENTAQTGDTDLAQGSEPASTGTGAYELAFQSFRRSDRHLDKNVRRSRRQRSRERASAALRPPGRVSAAFRTTLILISAVTCLSLVFPYLSFRLQQTAARNLGHDAATSVANTSVAAALNPVDPEPLALRSEAYSQAASTTAESLSIDAKSATLDNLCLAYCAAEDAIAQDTSDWSLYYMAGMKVLALANYERSAGEAADAFAPGAAEGSLANTQFLQDRCARLRLYSPARLVLAAHELFALASQLNPLEHSIQDRLQETTSFSP